MVAQLSPLESKDRLPVFLRHIFDELHFIQDQVFPPLPHKMALVFHQQLVRCQTNMEAIGFLPPLQTTKNGYAVMRNTHRINSQVNKKQILPFS